MSTATVADVKASLQNQYYGLVHLALASVAYIDSGDTTKMVNDFRKAIEGDASSPIPYPPLAPLPNPANGTTIDPAATWKLEWGPATADKNANLSYVATFGTESMNYLRVVGLRGTDTSSGKVDDLIQVFEDLGAFKQINWMETLAELALTPGQNPFKRIVVKGFEAAMAQGTTFALKTILNAKLLPEAPGSGTLIEHLHSMPDIEETPLIVTGHSLGGGLTQAVCMFLGWQIGGAFTKLGEEPMLDNIFPNAFAPPTAGDEHFAGLLDKIFPYNYFWYNESDLVPHAYQVEDIKNIHELWGAYPDSYTGGNGVPCPGFLKDAVFLLLPLLPKNYTRPSANLRSFKADYLGNPEDMQSFLDSVGSGTLKTDSWEAQLLWQHFPPCYYQNIAKSYASDLAEYPAFVFPLILASETA